MSNSLTPGWINNLLRIPNLCSAPKWWKDWESFQVPNDSFAESIFRHWTPCPKPITILNTSAWFVSKWACKNYQEAVAERNQTLIVVSITPQKQGRASLLSSCCAQVVTEFLFPWSTFTDGKACLHLAVPEMAPRNSELIPHEKSPP